VKLSLGPRPAKRTLDERLAFAVLFFSAFLAAWWFPFHRNPYICSFKQVTGYPCFTCGMTRSWVHHIHLEVLHGFVQSPLGSLLFVLALAFTVWTAIRLAFRLGSLRFGWTDRDKVVLWVGGVVLFLGNWLYTILTGVA